MRLNKLDALRGIAILGVMLVHSYGLLLADVSKSGPVSALSTLFSSGRFGVELFFLLSGFLIAYLYETFPNQSKSIKSFLLLRFFRIYPLWAVFSFIWFVVYFIQTGELKADAFILSLFFLLWISPVHFDTFIGGAWSIQIEVISYLIFVFLRGAPAKKLILLAVFVNFLGSAASLYSLDSEGIAESIRRLSLQTGFNFFLLGWLASRIARERMEARNEVLDQLTTEIPNRYLVVWIGSFLVTPAIYGNPIEAVGFVFLATVLTWFIREGSFVTRTLQWYGRHSYFLFFAHFLFLHLMVDFFVAIENFLTNDWLALALGLGIWVGMTLTLSPIAWISMKVFEGPLTKYARTVTWPLK